MSAALQLVLVAVAVVVLLALVYAVISWVHRNNGSW